MITLLLSLFVVQDALLSIVSFTPNNPFSVTRSITFTSSTTTRIQSESKDYIDAEFYTNDEDDETKTNSKSNNSKSNNSKSSSSSTSKSFTSTLPKKISPLQASLSSVEPKLSSLSMNFINPSLKSASKQSFIPCRIAFTCQYKDEDYVLGTPVDTQVGIYVEDNNSNTAYFLDPDEDDNIEVMERAASIFEMKYKHISLSDEEDDGSMGGIDSAIYSDDDQEEKKRLQIRFKRTPRTLTVEGDLGIITGNWREDERKDLEGIKDVAKNILNDTGEDSEEDDEYFDSFFTKELGSDYETEALKDIDLGEDEEELISLFNVPGLGTEKDDVDGIQDLIKDVLEDEKRAKEEGIGEKGAETALRLIGFNDEQDSDKVYSLVQLLQPMILIAKSDPSLEFDERLLLTKEEADEIVPFLEKQFSEEFEEAGISLS